MYGEFDSYDLLMTNKALYYYSLGVVALVLSRVLTSAFFGRQNTRTPVRIAVLTLFATQVMNLMFVWKLGHAGLALAIALAAWINVVLLSWNLYKQNILVPQKGWGIFLIRVFIALFVMALVLNFIVPLDEFWLNQIASIKILNLALMVLVGAISYFLVLLLTGMRVSDFTKLNFLS